MTIAIVVGATGLVGTQLVQHLAQEESINRVVAITRRPVAYGSEKIVNEVIDFDTLEKHPEIFTGDILFSCLGTTIKQAGSITEQRKVDFDYQYRAAKICSENGVSHYILVSSSGANAVSKSPYLKMKGELEREVSQLSFNQITIIQPSLLKGEREAFRLGEAIANWFLPLLCKLPFLRRYRPISGDEVAQKMVSVSLSQGTGHKKYRLDELFS